MSWWHRDQLVRGGLAAGAIGVVLVATFGVGYRSSEAVLGGAGGYFAKGNSVVHVNVESGDVDAEAAWGMAEGRERLEVVQVSPTSVYVLNHETGQAWHLPTDTMAPHPVGQPEGSGDREITGDGGRAYVLDHEDGSLIQIDESGVDESGEETPSRVATPGEVPVDQAVVDPSGTGWAYAGQTGELFVVDGTAVVATHRVADPGELARLTLVAGEPVVYRPEQGAVTRYGRAGQRGRPVTVPVERPHDALVSAPGGDDPMLAIVVRSRGELITVDLGESPGSDRVRRLALAGRAGNRMGSPVVAAGRVYVPDQRHRQVVVVEISPLREAGQEVVPGNGEFRLSYRDGRVFANDPYAQHLVVFHPDGRSGRIDKGTGDGVDPTHPDSPGASPEPTRSPEPTQPEPEDPESAQPEPEDPESAQPEPEDPESAQPEQPGDSSPEQPPADDTASVPALLGLSPDQACQALEASFLACAPNGSELHYRANVVLRQSVPAGTTVAAGTEVSYVYADTAPIPLYRYRIEDRPAWRLRLTPDPNDPTLINQRDFGGVYRRDFRPDDERLVTVYERACREGRCGIPRMYHYAPGTATPNRPVGGSAWDDAVPLFQCLRHPVPNETRPLWRMYDSDRQVWTFAVQGTAEWQNARDRGFQQTANPICQVWFGVEGYRPGG